MLKVFLKVVSSLFSVVYLIIVNIFGHFTSHGLEELILTCFVVKSDNYVKRKALKEFGEQDGKPKRNRERGPSIEAHRYNLQG